MLTLAVTGGIAMGKSSFGRSFLRESAPLSQSVQFFDCDLCVRELLTEPEITAKIASRFGNSVLNQGGQIDRPRLRDRVFNSASRRAELENILHPVVRQRCADEQNRALLNDEVDVFVIDVPLLYESGFNVSYDMVLVVACSGNLQRQRLLERPGITEDIAERIVAAQLPIATKMVKADIVLWNDGCLQEFENQIDVFSRWLKKKKIPKTYTLT
jgi:dephospho-CoA kinase